MPVSKAVQAMEDAEKGDDNGKRRSNRFLLEPIVILLTISSGITVTSNRSLWYNKTCLSLFDSHVCDDIRNATYAQHRQQIQITNAQWMFYNRISCGIPNLVLSIVYAYLFDKFSRRLIICMPMIGGLLVSMAYLYLSMLGKVPMWTLLLSDMVSAFCGGSTTSFNCIFAYCVIICRVDGLKIPMQTSILVGMMTLSEGIFIIVSGFILDDVNTKTNYIISITVHLILILYIYLRVPNTLHGEKKTENDSDKFGLTGMVVSSLKIVFKKRENSGRFIILMIFSIIAILLIASNGEIHYLYFRLMFNWSNSMYGTYVGSEVILSGITLLIIMPPIIKYLKPEDHTLGFIGIISYVLKNAYMGVCTSTLMVYSSLLINTPISLITIGLRSILARQVDIVETSRMFVMLGIVERITGMANAYLLDSHVYPLLVRMGKTYLVFYVTTAIAMISALMTWYLFMWFEKHPQKSLEDLENEKSAKYEDSRL